jgi:acetyl esterase/lipase
MQTKTFYLNNERTSYLKAYLLDPVEDIEFCKQRPAVLIRPGGGYTLCSPREGEPIAMQYLAQGMNAFVLNYTVNERYPRSLADAVYALYKIRLRADEFGIHPNKVAVVGFSAGGHLAGCLATMWGDVSILKMIGCEPEDIKPNAAVLCYPVISGITSPHKESFEVLLGDDPRSGDISRLSLENRVTPKTPPIFLWHTADDATVSAHNSLVMAKACVSNNVPVELHLFDSGPHGLSDCSKSTARNEQYHNEKAKQWIPLSIAFLQKYLDF